MRSPRSRSAASAGCCSATRRRSARRSARCPSGRRASASATYSLASVTISIALWPPVWNSETSIVGSTSNRAYWSVSSNPSTTVATSPSRGRLPSAPRPRHQVLELRPAVGLPDRPQHDLLPAPSAPTRPAGPATSGARHRPRLARGCDRRLDGPPPPGHLHHDRFRRQDGVVDQHPEGDDEGGQRHLIEADAEGPHHEERHDHRRHEARHHQPGPHAEEQQHHQQHDGVTECFVGASRRSPASILADELRASIVSVPLVEV